MFRGWVSGEARALVSAVNPGATAYSISLTMYRESRGTSC